MAERLKLQRVMLLAALGASLLATALVRAPARDARADSPLVGLCMASIAQQAGSLESVNVNASLETSGGDAHLDWEIPPANIACDAV
jgi:hypothetical protein